jgi:hypothetical protein
MQLILVLFGIGYDKKKDEMKKYMLIIAVLILGQIHAQTGIGTTTPHASAKLDVTATNKGFLPPRVTLTSNTDATTIPSPAEGLLVYNTGNNSGLVAGYYYWNGANWATIATAIAAGYGVAASEMQKIYDGVGNATTINSTGVTFTVPTSGTYLFDFSCSGTNSNGALTMNFFVRDGSTVIKSDMQTSYSNNVHAEYNGKVEVNLVTGKTYNVLVNTSSGNIYSNDYCRVYMKQMSGNLPINQHIANRNFQLNNNYLSNDGDNEGIRVDNSGKVGIGTDTPTSRLNIAGGGVRLATGFSNANNRPSLNTSTIGNYEIRAVGSGGLGTTQNDGADDGLLRLSAGGGTNASAQSSIDLSGFSNVADMSNNIVMRTEGTERIRIANSGKIGIGTTTPGTSLHIQNGNIFGADPDNTASPSLYVYNTNNASTTAHSTAVIRTTGSGGGNPYLAFDISGIRGYSIGIDNADSDKLKFHSNWNLNNSVTPAMTITNENRIGIGTNSPEAALHVASSVSQYVTSYGFLNTGGAGAGTYNVNVLYSIKADQRIRASEFNAISDARIKKDIFKLNTEKQLAELNLLKVVNYSYIDKLMNGDKNKTGFIAQEVEKVNPQFVNQSTEFIPSVFAIAKSVVLINDILQVTTDSPHGFEKGDVVKLFVEGKKEINKTIEEVKSPEEFLVKGWDTSTENVFVYGKKITDFRAIDFDQITALSVGAIQELSKQVEILKLENESLQKRISNEVQKKQSELEKRLLKLESKFNK